MDVKLMMMMMPDDDDDDLAVIIAQLYHSLSCLVV